MHEVLTDGDLAAGDVEVTVEVGVLGWQVGDGFAYFAGGDFVVIWVALGEDKTGLAAVGAEELGDDGAGVGAFGGFLYVVVGDLDGFATAVPAVGWIVGAPEGVVDAFGDAVEGLVLIADGFVAGGLVAEVWEESFLFLELLPAGGLGGGGDGGVVFGLEPGAVELGVDEGNLVAEIGEGAEVAFVVAEGGGDGAELLIVLGGGEAEDVLGETGEHEVVGGVPVDGNEIVAVTGVDALKEGAGGGMEEFGVVMRAFALAVDAGAEGGDFVGEIGKLVALGKVALDGRIKRLWGGARGRGDVPGCPY